ncbi:hypothetical protein [Streptomyces sp. NPDC018352]|uniref:hypothetical protein n=1 Tax=Streptomyces sp. NPDC018352 TaxID=3157194 RepID=UPI0033E25763
MRVHETYHRAPTGLAQDKETSLATNAVARLRSAGYHVDCDENFDTDSRWPSYLPVGSSVARLADWIRDATTTDDASRALTELTATHDGVLAALGQVLTAAAEFHEGLGDEADPHVARQLRYLADEHLQIIHTDLSYTRNALIDRQAPHPGRSICTEEVPATERERSAACACPPPPRTVPATPPPPVASGLRR